MRILLLWNWKLRDRGNNIVSDTVILTGLTTDNYASGFSITQDPSNDRRFVAQIQRTGGLAALPASFEVPDQSINLSGYWNNWNDVPSPANRRVSPAITHRIPLLVDITGRTWDYVEYRDIVPNNLLTNTVNLSWHTNTATLEIELRDRGNNIISDTQVLTGLQSQDVDLTGYWDAWTDVPRPAVTVAQSLDEMVIRKVGVPGNVWRQTTISNILHRGLMYGGVADMLLASAPITKTNDQANHRITVGLASPSVYDATPLDSGEIPFYDTASSSWKHFRWSDLNTVSVNNYINSIDIARVNTSRGGDVRWTIGREGLGNLTADLNWDKMPRGEFHNDPTLRAESYEVLWWNTSASQWRTLSAEQLLAATSYHAADSYRTELFDDDWFTFYYQGSNEFRRMRWDVLRPLLSTGGTADGRLDSVTQPNIGTDQNHLLFFDGTTQIARSPFPLAVAGAKVQSFSSAVSAWNFVIREEALNNWNQMAVPDLLKLWAFERPLTAPESTDWVLYIDHSDSDRIKRAAISQLPGGGTGTDTNYYVNTAAFALSGNNVTLILGREGLGTVSSNTLVLPDAWDNWGEVDRIDTRSRLTSPDGNDHLPIYDLDAGWKYFRWRDINFLNLYDTPNSYSEIRAVPGETYSTSTWTASSAGQWQINYGDEQPDWVRYARLATSATLPSGVLNPGFTVNFVGILYDGLAGVGNEFIPLSTLIFRTTPYDNNLNTFGSINNIRVSVTETQTGAHAEDLRLFTHTIRDIDDNSYSVIEIYLPEATFRQGNAVLGTTYRIVFSSVSSTETVILSGYIPTIKSDGTGLEFVPSPAGITSEYIQDIVGAMIQPGTGTTVHYNDSVGIVTIGATGGGGGSGWNSWADVPVPTGSISVPASNDRIPIYDVSAGDWDYLLVSSIPTGRKYYIQS